MDQTKIKRIASIHRNELLNKSKDEKNDSREKIV